MVYIERILLVSLLVAPFLLPVPALAWTLLSVSIVSGFLAVTGERWVVWPMAGLALLEALVLLVLGLDVNIALAGVHLILVILVAYPIWLFPIPCWQKPRGQYEVGYREFDLPPGLSEEEHAERSGRVFAWYPAASYALIGRRLQTRAEARALEEVQTYLGKPPHIQAHMQHGRTYAQEQGEPAEGLFPLIVFNHGGALWPNQNFSLMETLSAAGYVVISVGHPEESAGLIYKDGFVQTLSAERVAELRGTEASMRSFAEHLTSETITDQRKRIGELASLQTGTQSGCDRWARHTLAVIEWFKGRVEAGDLAIQIDFERIVYVGMSMGGSVAYRCCQLDDRAIGGVNMDGMIWDFEHASKPLRTPFLMCYSDLAELRKSVIAHMGWKRNPKDGIPFNSVYFEESEADVVSVEYPDSSHMNFTDFGWAVRGVAKKQFGLGQANPRTIIQSINQLVLAFANDCAGLSEGSLARHLEERDDWRPV